LACRLAGDRRRLEELIRVARSIDDRFFEGVAQLHLGWIDLFTDDPDGALLRFREQMRISTEIGSEDGIAFSLEGLFTVAAKRGDIVTAGRFLGAAEVVRERKG